MAVDPALLIFPDEYVPSAEDVPYHGKWARANPAEAKRWAAFRDDVIAGKQVTPPSMQTRYGKALVAAGKEHMSITRVVGQMTNPYPPPDPPPSSNPPSPPQGTLRFEDTFEGSTLIPPWTAAPNGSDGVGTNGDLSLVTTEGGVTPRHGSKMLKAFVSTANRASWSATTLQASLIQKSGMDQTQIGLGNDVYYGGSLYIVAGFQATSSTAHVSLVEWHGHGPMSQAPIHFGILGNGGGAGQWFIDLHREATGYSPVFQPALGAFTTGHWLDWVIRTKWSNGTDGNVTIWFKAKDGSPLTDANKQFEFNGATWNKTGEGIYAIIGVYRGIQSNAGTVYFDSVRIGTTKEIVDPGSYT